MTRKNNNSKLYLIAKTESGFFVTFHVLYSYA